MDHRTITGRSWATSVHSKPVFVCSDCTFLDEIHRAALEKKERLADRGSLVDRPTEKPWGAGEPSAAVVPSAISNAVFDATGTRLRSVPYTADKVKGALRGAA